MKATIVLCTYNGEKYIVEQLDSIRLQTRKADEVLIFDDRSMDSTADVIKNYIRKWDVDWKFRVNERNKGWKKNFTDGFKEATGDVILCCDQDDIWYPEKIDIMCRLLEDDKVKLLGCKVRMCDDRGKTIKKHLGSMPDSRESCELNKVEFDYTFYASREPGCAIAFKRELLDIYFKYWDEYYPHDQLLWNIARCIDGAYEVDKILMDYRRSLNSVFESGSKNRSTERRIGKIKELKKKIDVIGEIQSVYDKEEKKKNLVSDSKQWVKNRIEFVCHKKVIAMFHLIRFIKFYGASIMLLVDCYDCMNVIIMKREI